MKITATYARDQVKKQLDDYRSKHIIDDLNRWFEKYKESLESDIQKAIKENKSYAILYISRYPFISRDGFGQDCGHGFFDEMVLKVRSYFQSLGFKVTFLNHCEWDKNNYPFLKGICVKVSWYTDDLDSNEEDFVNFNRRTRKSNNTNTSTNTTSNSDNIWEFNGHIPCH